MLQDTQTVRYYQKLTDAMVDLWNRGRRYEEIRLYIDGYLSCLRQTNALEPYLIHRLEEEIFRFLRDPSNFELALPQLQTEVDYY
jgi:type II restriction/modification system DNA methylase subunit YeeA